MADRALTVKDLIERYGVTEGTVLGWIRTGELQAINVGRRPGAKKPRWRVTPEQLAAFELLRTASQPTRACRRKRQLTDVIDRY